MWLIATWWHQHLGERLIHSVEVWRIGYDVLLRIYVPTSSQPVSYSGQDCESMHTARNTAALVSFLVG